LDEEGQYLFDERAAIMEHDGLQPRHVAERYAQRSVNAIIRSMGA
jgi:hypothetical protein